jgi:hypothetical protein
MARGLEGFKRVRRALVLYLVLGTGFRYWHLGSGYLI